MKYRIIAIFVLIFSLNANSYCPVFLDQKQLDQSSEKLIIKINSVSSEIIYPGIKNYSKGYLDYYAVKLSAEVQFVEQSDSNLREGDIIYLSYITHKDKPNIRPGLCGNQPLPTPQEQNSCLAYLNKKGDNYKFNKSSWSLQIVTDDNKTSYLDSKYTPDWAKIGIKKILATTVE